MKPEQNILDKESWRNQDSGDGKGEGARGHAGKRHVYLECKWVKCNENLLPIKHL